MSSPIDDGGPAFPHTHESWHTYPKGKAQPPPGMTLRDWFAGQALIGLVSDGNTNFSVSKEAYRLADAMIVARKEAK